MMRHWSTSALEESTVPKSMINVSKYDKNVNGNTFCLDTVQKSFVFVCSQSVPRCAQEVLERLHVVLSEDK